MFSETIYFLKDYYKFRRISKPRGGHGIHSPFVYDLYTQVIDISRKESIFEDIETLRKKLLNNKTIAVKSSFGAGSIINSKTSLNEIAKKASVSPYLGRLLFRLANYFKPKTIIELGTSLGISTLYLAAANNESKVYSIEGDSALTKIASENLNKLGVTNVSLITGDFDNELAVLINKIENIGMVFIDGNHTEDATVKYFNLILEKTNHDSFIIFDDIRWSEGMRKAWQSICTDERVSISIDLFNCGIVFFRKGIVKQHFNLRYGPF